MIPSKLLYGWWMVPIPAKLLYGWGMGLTSAELLYGRRSRVILIIPVKQCLSGRRERGWGGGPDFCTAAFGMVGRVGQMSEKLLYSRGGGLRLFKTFVHVV